MTIETLQLITEYQGGILLQMSPMIDIPGQSQILIVLVSFALSINNHLHFLIPQAINWHYVFC